MVKHDPFEIGEIYQNIPVWNNGKWELRDFESRDEFARELDDNYLIEPGEMELDEVIYQFQAQSIKFTELGYYCEFEEGSFEFEDYWDWEKLKCRKGAFFYHNDKKFYLPRYYYFWINFVKIPDKVKRKDAFTGIWDTQIWMALYEFIAELDYEFAAVLKKRQFGSSLFHIARLINILWFEESAVLKLGASDFVYLTGINGSWKFAQKYRSFLNKNTAWRRPMNPNSVGNWEQKTEMTDEHAGSTFDEGNMSTLQALSFQKSDTAGVGGLCTEFFYEEAGITASMDTTLQYMIPGMESGDIVTGFFVAAGTVGDLDQCKPLKKFIYKPERYRIKKIRNKWCNSKGSVLETGLFVPEQYSMPPFIDTFGNSLVDKALARLKEMYEMWEQNLEVDECQIKKSQHPITLEVAFSARSESKFPLGMVNSHKLSIQDGDYPFEILELEENVDNELLVKKSNRVPIREFPVDKKMVDKTGAIMVWERPDGWESGKEPDWGTYYASIDPVRDGKTVASDSLCTIYVYKNPIQVTRFDEHVRAKNHIEGDKVVCAWAGRYDDINDTHKELERIIRWYNAWTLVEVNVSLFILHMIHHHLQKYLVPKSEMIFLKEHGHNKGTFQEYGWKNTGTIFDGNLLPYLIESLKEKIDIETDENGEVVSVTYGITRIPDTMALEEMLQYEHGLNVDRLISLAALMAFVKLQNANRGYKKRVETESHDIFDKSDKIAKLNKDSSPYRHLGKKPTSGSGRKKRGSPFKHLK